MIQEHDSGDLKIVLYVFLIVLIYMIFLSSVAAQKRLENMDAFMIGGVHGGYSFKANSPTFALELGLRTSDVYFGVQGLERLSRVASSPFIAVFKLGYNIYNVQLFYAPSYQTVGRENSALFKNEYKWLGYGISYYFNHVVLTGMRVGQETNLSIGTYFNF